MDLECPDNGLYYHGAPAYSINLPNMFHLLNMAIILATDMEMICHMWTTNAQISLRIRAVWSAPLLFAA